MTKADVKTKKAVETKSAFGEFIRKRLVNLKRRPSIIVLLSLLIAFVYFSFNLTQISDTTAKCQLPNMGLAGFAIMLFSILSLVCMLNAFPKRKKTNIPMLVLAVVLIVIILVANHYYQSCIITATTREVAPLSMTDSNICIANAQHVMRVHAVLLYITAGLLVTLPLYSRLIKKINTNVIVADNEGMGTIDISGED